MPSPRESTSCGACVYKVTRDGIFVLLVKPFADKDNWGLPKGHNNPKESFEACALREVFEETGLKISLEECLTPVYAKSKHENKRVIIFLARQIGEDEPFPNDGEVVDVQWFNVDSLPTIHYYQRPVVREALLHLRFKVFGEIPPEILAKFDVVYSYANSSDNWLEIKKQLVWACSVPTRKFFSRRHELSKKQQTNALERRLGEMWEKRTGRPLSWPAVHERNDI